LLTVAGRPFVEHQLELLKSHGARRIVLSVGYLGEQIEAAIADGSQFGLEIAYVHDGPEPAGTAGAVRRALPVLGDEFLVLYGDTYLRIDYVDVARAFRESGLPALMTVLRNRGRMERSNAVFRDGRVTAYDKQSPPPDAEWIDYGLLAFERSAVDDNVQDDLADLTRDLATAGQLAGYEATERFYDIGTPEALAETERFLA
jgi:N-acetyl-alpha-D-muramate 1-phosphate uridylyltransferase